MTSFGFFKPPLPPEEDNTSSWGEPTHIPEETKPTNWSTPAPQPEPIRDKGILSPTPLPPPIYDRVVVPPLVNNVGAISPRLQLQIDSVQPTQSIMDRIRGVKDRVMDFVTEPVKEGRRYRVVVKRPSDPKKLRDIKGKGFTLLNTRLEISDVGDYGEDMYFVATFRRVK